MSPKKETNAIESEMLEITEPVVGLAELIAMGRVPDNHAFALRLYVGDDAKEMPLSKWAEVYEEFMSKPTNMSKSEWHELFVKTKKER